MGVVSRMETVLRRLDLRGVLDTADVYSLFRRLVIATPEDLSVRAHVRAQKGDRILDIGCGPADVLAFLPDVSYVGFDASPRYVAAARRRFGDRGEFHCRDVTEAEVDVRAAFDIVLATGVLHHLDDAKVVHLFRLAHQALVPGGRLVTLDGCYTEHQSFGARTILSWDRGKYVRTESAYVALARAVFDDVAVTIRSDLLRIPYTHIILECKRGESTDQPVVPR